MINKTVLKDPHVEFDFSNDYEDTIRWLERTDTEKANTVALILLTRILDWSKNE